MFIFLGSEYKINTKQILVYISQIAKPNLSDEIVHRHGLNNLFK